MDEKTYKKKIVDNMKAVGTYRPEFLKTVENLAKIYVDMDNARKQFDESGGQIVIAYTNKNGSTNMVKNPCYQAIEGLQNNILLYGRELGLTPAGLKKIKGEAGKETRGGGLAAALIALEK